MEHINAACKYAIAVFWLQGASGKHDMPSLSKDIAAVVKQLVQRSSVFCRKKDVTDLSICKRLNNHKSK